MNPIDPNSRPPRNLNDPKQFVAVPVGAQEPGTPRSLRHPDEREAHAAVSAQEYLSRSSEAEFRPTSKAAPAKQAAALSIDPRRSDIPSTGVRLQRSAGMQRLLRTYGLQQIQNADIDVGDGLTIVVRPMGKEDEAWAQERTAAFAIGNERAAEMVYMMALAAVVTAAIRTQDDAGNWVTESMPVALGLLSEAQMAQVRDPLFPPYVIRRLCSEELFRMFAGLSETREENILAHLGETIAIGWEEKIGQRAEDIAAPLVQIQAAMREPTGKSSPSTSTSEEESQQNSEQQ